MSLSHYMLSLSLLLTSACNPINAVEAAPHVPSGGAIGGADDDLFALPSASRPYVQIETVAQLTEHATIRAPARVAFRDGGLSRIGPPVAGRVVKLHVDVGDRVKVGQPLLTITSPMASEFHMELARARIDVATTRDQLDRQTKMVSEGVGRVHERIFAEHRLAEAQAKLRHAQKTVSLLGKSSNGTVVVVAMIEGTVLRRSVTLGAQVQPGGDPLIEIGNPKALRAVAEVFQDDLPLVSAGAEVTLEFANLTTPVTGRVEGLGVLVDTGLRRAPIYVSFDAAEPGLTPGMFGRASIKTALPTGVTIPRSAVLIKNGGTPVVFVEQGEAGQFSRRAVTVGHSFAGYVQVLAGLEPGERVVVAGALLIDGTVQRVL